MPECNTALAQCVTYMAAAPKSNAVYTAYGAAAHDALTDVASPVPVTRVGSFATGSGLTLTDHGRSIDLPSRLGFQH